MCECDCFLKGINIPKEELYTTAKEFLDLSQTTQKYYSTADYIKEKTQTLESILSGHVLNLGFGIVWHEMV